MSHIVMLTCETLSGRGTRRLMKSPTSSSVNSMVNLFILPLTSLELGTTLSSPPNEDYIILP